MRYQSLTVKLECFNTQPPEGGCAFSLVCSKAGLRSVSSHFETFVAAVDFKITRYITLSFQHTATRRWLPLFRDFYRLSGYVSTHSHPKVAAHVLYPVTHKFACFNTQPPEGGCVCLGSNSGLYGWFQHTATRRWLHMDYKTFLRPLVVSTHSHPKVAAYSLQYY